MGDKSKKIFSSLQRQRASSFTSLNELQKRKRGEEVEESLTLGEEEAFKRSKLVARSPPKGIKKEEGMDQVLMQLAEIKASIHTGNEDLKNEMRKMQETWGKEKEEMKEEIGALKEKIVEMDTEIESLKKSGKKKNVVISGVRWGGNYKNRFVELCKSELQVDVAVDEAYKIAEVRGGHEVVLATFKSMSDKLEVMKVKNKLGKTGVYINDDYTQKEQRIQKELRDLAKKEKANGNMAVKVGYQKITISGVTKKWSELSMNKD